MPRPFPLFITCLVGCAIVTAGCGGASDVGASDSSGSRVDSTPAPAQAAAPAPHLVVPYDDQQGALWVRDFVSIYAHAYQACGDMVDIHSPSYRAENVVTVSTLENTLTERARGTSERAAWVAFTGCQDGITDYPYPGIPEVAYLQRTP